MGTIASTHPAPKAGGGIGHGVLGSWQGRVAIVLAALVVSGTAIYTWRSREAAAPVTYRTQSVARGTVTQTVAVSGSLAAAADQVRVFFSSSGRIAQIPVREGDAVAQGQTIAVLDVGDLQNALRQAQVGLVSAQAKYEQTVATATPEDVAIAQASVDAAQQTYEAALRSTGMDVAAAQQAMDKTTRDYRSAQTSFTLVTEGIGADVPHFATTIADVRAIVWTTIVDFRSKSTADVTTAKSALGQADSALLNASTDATGTLADALAQWSSARDGVISAWLLFDDSQVRGTDPSGAASQLASAEVAYTLAAARLETALAAPTNGLSSAETSVSQAQSAMGSQTSSIDPDLDVVRADLVGLQTGIAAEVDLSDTIASKVSQAATQLATISDAVGGAYVTAQQTLDSAKNTAAQTVASQASALRSAQLSLQKTTAAPQQADITAAYASVQLAQLALDQAQQDLDDATLRAPVAGTLVSIANAVGDLASSSGTDPFALLDPSGAMQLQGTVGEANVSKLQNGQAANVSIAALGGGAPVTGKVSSIDRVATISSGVPVYGVAVDIAKPPAMARIGMTATASVVIATKANVLTIPNLAIRSQGGRRYVDVLRAGTPAEVVPVFGITNGTITEVVSGLAEGDQVVLPQPAATAPQRTSTGGGVNVPGLRP